MISLGRSCFVEPAPSAGLLYCSGVFSLLYISLDTLAYWINSALEPCPDMESDQRKDLSQLRDLNELPRLQWTATWKPRFDLIITLAFLLYPLTSLHNTNQIQPHYFIYKPLSYPTIPHISLPVLNRYNRKQRGRRQYGPKYKRI